MTPEWEMGTVSNARNHVCPQPFPEVKQRKLTRPRKFYMGQTTERRLNSAARTIAMVWDAQTDEGDVGSGSGSGADSDSHR